MIEQTEDAYEAMGYPDSKAMKEKALLVYEMAQVIHSQKLTPREIAEKTGIDELRLHGILRGHFRDLTVTDMQLLRDRLMAN